MSMTKNERQGTRLTPGTKRMEGAKAPAAQETADRPEPGKPATVGVTRRTFTLEHDPEALRRIVAGVLMEFARTVEPRDLCCFVFLLANGNLTQVAQELGMARSTLYERIESWATRGPAYQRMLKLITCRKVGGTPEMVPLGATLEAGQRSGETENPDTLAEVLEQINPAAGELGDYPALLRDLQGALQAMNGRNWQNIRSELMALIAEEIPDTR